MRTLAEMLQSMTWGGRNTEAYPGYNGIALFGPSAAETGAKTRMTGMDLNAGTNAAAQNSTLSQVEGPVTQTAMYKRLLGLSTEGTTQAFNMARQSRSAAAKRAGFGYASPIAQTDAATTSQAEAQQIGNLPRQVAQDVMPYSMEAAKMRGSNIGTYTGAGTSSMQTWAQLEQARQNRIAKAFSSIAGMGMKMATGGMFGGGAAGGADDISGQSYGANDDYMSQFSDH